MSQHPLLSIKRVAAVRGLTDQSPRKPGAHKCAPRTAAIEQHADAKSACHVASATFSVKTACQNRSPISDGKEPMPRSRAPQRAWEHIGNFQTRPTGSGLFCGGMCRFWLATPQRKLRAAIPQSSELLKCPTAFQDLSGIQTTDRWAVSRSCEISHRRRLTRRCPSS